MNRVKREINHGEMLPPWYGVAYRDFVNDRMICYPIPFNLIVRSLRNIYWRLRGPGYDFKNETWLEGYRSGYRAGCDFLGRYRVVKK